MPALVSAVSAAAVVLIAMSPAVPAVVSEAAVVVALALVLA